MALFDLKAVFDPLAQEFREGYGEVHELLLTIRERLDVQNELTQSTNRLLAKLVEQGDAAAVQRAALTAGPPRTAATRTIKTPAVKP